MGACFTSKKKESSSAYKNGQENIKKLSKTFEEDEIPWQEQISSDQAPDPKARSQLSIQFERLPPFSGIEKSQIEDILSDIENIYTNTLSKIKVVKAHYNHEGVKKLVATKIQTVDTFDEVNEKMNEVKLLQELTEVPRVVTVYDCKWIPSQTGAGIDILFIQEYGQKNLQEVIRLRGLENPPRYWSENQLISFLYDCVEVLAQAQEKGIAHRDIKPANILIFADDDFKFCDFGVSKFSADESTWNTIVGTPTYLSYLLYKALYTDRKIDQTKINWFKQDMVSLGIMILNMAWLTAKHRLNNLEDAASKQQEVLEPLPYSEDFKTILSCMLNVNEKLRPDFIKLRKTLRSVHHQHVLIGMDQRSSDVSLDLPQPEFYNTEPAGLDMNRVDSVPNIPQLVKSYSQNVKEKIEQYQAEIKLLEDQLKQRDEVRKAKEEFKNEAIINTSKHIVTCIDNEKARTEVILKEDDIQKEIEDRYGKINRLSQIWSSYDN